jgi:hypothetical protein
MHQRGLRGHLILGGLRISIKDAKRKGGFPGNGEENQGGNARGAGLPASRIWLGAAET